MPSLSEFFNSVLGIGDRISEWVTFTFAGDTVTAVLSFLRVFLSYIPGVLMDLAVAAFGGMVIISILRGIGR